MSTKTTALAPETPETAPATLKEGARYTLSADACPSGMKVFDASGSETSIPAGGSVQALPDALKADLLAAGLLVEEA